MYDYKTQWINDSQPANQSEAAPPPAPRDGDLLDAYSQAVVRVVGIAQHLGAEGIGAHEATGILDLLRPRAAIQVDREHGQALPP